MVRLEELCCSDPFDSVLCCCRFAVDFNFFRGDIPFAGDAAAESSPPLAPLDDDETAVLFGVQDSCFRVQGLEFGVRFWGSGAALFGVQDSCFTH
jgi:hypothetical protein